jgi:hypothetical protein
MLERLSKIEAYGKKKEDERVDALIKQNKKIAELEEKIASLSDEINELITVGNACVKHNIRIKLPIVEHGGYEKHNFVTDGITHILGFEWPRNGEKITRIGIQGGGACTKEIFVDKEGNIDIRGHKEYSLQSFVDNFEEFKEKFYDYVDNLIK